MKEEYYPTTQKQKLGYLIEECGEVLHAAGKLLRWGGENYNPDVQTKDRETNSEWLLRELKDLKLAIQIIEEEFHEEP